MVEHYQYDAEIYSPGLTEDYEDASPDNLLIQFKYDFSKLNREQIRPEGDPSVARIDLVGEEITAGISLSPAKKGKWSWVSDRAIQFEPETDWPAGTKYSVDFDKSIWGCPR